MPDWAGSGAWPWWRPSTPRYPDTLRFEAGDLLLFSYPADDLAAKIRRGQQLLGYATEHAEFTHAAVYLGSDCVLCDAAEQGVRLHLLPSLVMPPAGLAPNQDAMLVRRVPRKNSAVRARIAATALSYLDSEYGHEDLVRIKTSIRHRQPLPESADSGLLCSMLFSRSWSRAIPGARLPVYQAGQAGEGEPIVLPAALAATELLETVNWQSLPVRS